jgi:hypothetical protein
MLDIALFVAAFQAYFVAHICSPSLRHYYSFQKRKFTNKNSKEELPFKVLGEQAYNHKQASSKKIEESMHKDFEAF